MQRLGKNHGAYAGEGLEVETTLAAHLAAAERYGWQAEWVEAAPAIRLLALCRSLPHPRRRVYLSAGIHGDEPAGPLAVRQLLEEDAWPADCALWMCPCLNPTGFPFNRRENALGTDLNRDYRHRETAEVRAHIAWLERQPRFDLALCLHEDWEAHGFYVYELNPEHRPSLAERIVSAVAQVCPIDPSPMIDGREAGGGIIRPAIDPNSRPQWPEAFHLVQHKTTLSYTLEAPSDFPLPVRVAALVAGVRGALAAL
jgi:predicted deacylase